MKKNRNSVRRLAFCALVAAVYAALTMALGFMSYNGIQFRVAEALCVLPFFFPSSAWGLFIGCVIANLLSPAGPLDVVFGSLATLLCCLGAAALGKGEKTGLWRKILFAGEEHVASLEVSPISRLSVVTFHFPFAPLSYFMAV